MNLRPHFHFLRPLRSLIFVSAIVLFAGFAGTLWFHLSPDTSWLMALVILLPLLLGLIIAGAAHEPMHRPFALVLPDIRRRQRTFAATSLLISTLTVTLVTRCALPTISPVATLGLVGALCALSCLNRHRGWASLAGNMAMLMFWLGTTLVIGTGLGWAMNAAPAIFLLGGLAVFYASLRFGFSRSSARMRARIPYQASQTMLWSYASHPDMMIRGHAEMLALRNGSKVGISTADSKWPVRSVGSTTSDWLKVIRHANRGGQKRSLSSKMFVNLFAGLLGTIVVFAAIGSFFLHQNFWLILASLPTLELTSRASPMAVGLMTGWTLLLPAFAKSYSALPVRIQLAYPISRQRLAGIVHFQTNIHFAMALVIPMATVFLVSLAGQFETGRYLPAYGLPELLAIDVLLAVLLPLALIAQSAQKKVLFVRADILFMALIYGTALHPAAWSKYALTPAGLFLLIMAAGFSQWLLWRRLKRYYATSDSAYESVFFAPVGATFSK